MKSIGECLIIIFLICLSLEATTTLRLIEQVELEGPKVLLQDVALIEGDDFSLREKVRKLSIDEVPVLGRSQLISSFKIQRILEKHLSFEERQNIEIRGSQTYVACKSRKVSTKDLKKFVRDWVEKQIVDETEFSIQYLHIPDNFLMPKSEKAELVIEHSSKRGIGGTHSLAIRSMLSSKVMSSTRIRIVTKLFAELPTLIEPIKRGAVFNKSYVQYQKTDITNTKAMVLRSLKSVEGRVAKRDLGVGSVLFERDFDQPILISRGSLNRLLIVNGTVRMSLAGAKALSDGKEGQFILFSHPLNPKKTIRAQVMAKGLARLDL